jgi:hypothetical protein
MVADLKKRVEARMFLSVHNFEPFDPQICDEGKEKKSAREGTGYIPRPFGPSSDNLFENLIKMAHV